MRTWLTAALILMLLGLQYRLWVADGGLAHTHRLNQELARQQNEIDQLSKRNAALDAEVHSLKSGVDEIETRARASLGLVKKDETFYLVVHP